MRNYWKETPNCGRALAAEFSNQLFAMTSSYSNAKEAVVACSNIGYYYYFLISDHLKVGTGIIAVVLRSLPYTFPGLYILADIVWVFTLILTAVFVALLAAKWILFPASSYYELSHEPERCFFYSSLSITASTLLNACAQILGSTWAGWDVACMILWWIDVVVAVLCAILPVWVAVRTHHIELGGLPPTAFLPGTSLLSTGAAGAIIIDNTTLSIRASLPVYVVSCILIGMGFFIALITLAAYYSRLLTSYTPEPAKALSCFLPVAALANTALACSLLGRIAGPSRNLLAEYGQGFVANTENIGLGLYGAGVVLGLGLLGIATYWLIFAMLVAISDIRKSPFNITTWAPIYPLGVYATACGQFAQDFDSPAFRTINTIFLFIILFHWFYCMARTVPMIITGELFISEAFEQGRTWEKNERFSEALAVRTAIQDEESQSNQQESRDQHQDRDQDQTSPQNTLVGDETRGESSQRETAKGDSRTVFRRTASQR